MGNNKTNDNIFQGFKPRQDRVLVKPDDVEEITAGGIIIPNQSKMAEVPSRGIVLAIGPEVDDLKPGDRVLYGEYAGFNVKHMGSDYRLIRASDAFAEIDQ